MGIDKDAHVMGLQLNEEGRYNGHHDDVTGFYTVNLRTVAVMPSSLCVATAHPAL